MPQLMRRNVSAESLTANCPKAVKESLPTQRAAVVREEDIGTFLLGIVLGPYVANVGNQRIDCRRAEGHDSVLTALAIPDLCESVLQIKIGLREVNQFACLHA